MVVLLLALLVGIALWPSSSRRPSAPRATETRVTPLPVRPDRGGGSPEALTAEMPATGSIVHGSDVPHGSTAASAPVEPKQELDGSGEDDWQRLSAICGAMTPTTVHWLRAQAFETPWLDDRVRPVVSVAPDVAALVQRPFPGAIADALLLLSGPLEPFAEAYERYTCRDPLIPSEEWRFYGWGEDPAGVAEAELLAAPARLAELSTRVADAADELLTVTAQHGLPTADQRLRRSGTA